MRDEAGTQTEFKTKSLGRWGRSFSIVGCRLRLERKREGDAISPVARAVTITVSIIVVIQTVRVGENAQIVADLVPVVRDISAASRTIHGVLDLRTDIQNSAGLIAALVHVAAIAVLVGEIIGRSDKAVGKLLEIIVVVVAAVPTTVVPVVNTIKTTLEVASSVPKVLDRTADVPIVTAVAVVVVVAIVAAVVVVIAIVAVAPLRRSKRGQGQNYESQCKNRSYFRKSFHLMSPGNYYFLADAVADSSNPFGIRGVAIAA